jgi:hypothetical protein
MKEKILSALLVFLAILFWNIEFLHIKIFSAILLLIAILIREEKASFPKG